MILTWGLAVEVFPPYHPGRRLQSTVSRFRASPYSHCFVKTFSLADHAEVLAIRISLGYRVLYRRNQLGYLIIIISTIIIMMMIVFLGRLSM